MVTEDSCGLDDTESSDNDLVKEDTRHNQISSAIVGLERGIHKFLMKEAKKLSRKNLGEPPKKSKIPSSVSKLLRQAHFRLRRLMRQVEVLENASRCLLKKLHPKFLQLLADAVTAGEDDSVFKKRLLLLFQHLFSQVLRIQDGMILCASGECRHAGDIEEAKRWQRKYGESRLPSREDEGIGKLYSSSHVYSGTSWDEFMDSKVGIQARLIKAIGSAVGRADNDIWDDLGESATCPLDAVLSAIEIIQRNVKNATTDYCKKVLPESLARYLKLEIVLADKSEKLIATAHSGANRTFSFQLKRRGREFEIHDPHGVLPLHWTTVRQWWGGAMGVFSSHNTSNNNSMIHSTQTASSGSHATSRNQTRVDHRNVAHPPIHNSCGLVVQIRRDSTENDNNVDVSLDAIKKNFGVDTEILRKSLQALESEESRTRLQPAAIDEGTKGGYTEVNSEAPSACLPSPQQQVSQPLPQVQKYRKWGDERLKQKDDGDGGSFPIYSYPLLPPVMPPEIKEMLESYKQRQAKLND